MITLFSMIQGVTTLYNNYRFYIRVFSKLGLQATYFCEFYMSTNKSGRGGGNHKITLHLPHFPTQTLPLLIVKCCDVLLLEIKTFD